MPMRSKTSLQLESMRWAEKWLYANGYVATKVSSLGHLRVEQIAAIVRDLADTKKRLAELKCLNDSGRIKDQ